MVQQPATKNGDKTATGPGNDPPSGSFCGPWLRFQGFDPATNTWTLSLLVVAKAEHSAGGTPSVRVGEQSAQGVQLDTHEDWIFWRFEFGVPLTQQEAKHTYSLVFSTPLPGAKPSYSFATPALGKPLRWGFKSCDWFSGGVSKEQQTKMGGYTPVWNDILRTHETAPLHFMVNGGDQIYADPCFLEVPELIEWGKYNHVRDLPKAIRLPATDGLKRNVTSWYFNHYMKSFQRDRILDVMASIPQICEWDDHDVYDGYGSYPERLQNCPTFQAVFHVAERFYLLFQQHTTKEMAVQHGFFGLPSYHYLKLLGPEVAILGMDMRAQRTLKHVVTAEGYKAIFERLNTLPSSVKHLVVVSAVPVVYPEVPFSEKSLRVISCINTHLLSMCTTNKASGGFFRFGQAELLDDLVDHYCTIGGMHHPVDPQWGSSVHKRERKSMIRKFQELSKQRSLRVSFISGDVHLAAVGLLYSNPKPEDPKSDHRWMLNVTSSASVNVPPPNGLVTAMNKTNHAGKIDSKTKEKMVRMFKGAPNALSDKLMPKRNWCAVATSASAEGGDMVFTLRVEPEGPEPDKPSFATYSITAPPLAVGKGAATS